MKLFLILLFASTLLCANCMSSDSSNKSCSVVECINNGNSDLSSAIICNECTAKIVSNSEAASLFREVQQKMDNNGRIRIADLHTNALQSIFDHLNITEILSLMKLYPSRNILVATKSMFAQRYKDYSMRIEPESQLSISFDDDSKCIEVSSKKAPKMLRLFGNLINDLDVQFPSSIISKYINKYASNSLKRLQIHSVNEETFKHFTKPLKRVKELLVSFDKYREIHIGHSSFNQLFPSLRQLALYQLDSIDSSSIVCKYPLLERLEISTETENEERIFEEILSKNAQIKAININSLSKNICKAINTHVPSLENLTIESSLSSVEYKTSFEHVKHLEYNDDQFVSSSNLDTMSFPRLVSLQIVYTKEMFDQCPVFFRKHEHLSHLKIKNVEGSESHRLTQLLSELPNLTEITIEHQHYAYQEINFETIDEIITNHPKICAINLLSFPVQENEFNNFEKSVEYNWNITSWASNIGMTFNLRMERKN